MNIITKIEKVLSGTKVNSRTELEYLLEETLYWLKIYIKKKENR